MKLPEKVRIVEVGPRDGFQNIKEWIPTEDKLKIIEGLIKSGLSKIEVTSFVHPKAIPQMKDSKLIAIHVKELNSQFVSHKNIPFISNALVPNLFGAKAAYEAGLDEITFVVSASESHNKANVNRSLDESLEELKLIKDTYPDAQIKVDIGTVFGCPFEGKIGIENIYKIIDYCEKLSISQICLCDTIGIANPKQVEALLTTILEKYKDCEFSLHFHDTRGMALANILVALQVGVYIFETSIGGLGGCPFAPGAAGNVATEDVVNMLSSMGVETKVDMEGLKKVITLVKELKEHLDSHLAYV